MASTTISQLQFLPSIRRKFHLQRRSMFPCANLRSQLPLHLSVVMSLEGSGTDGTKSESKKTSSYAAGASKSYVEGTATSDMTIEEHAAENTGTSEPEHEDGVTQHKRAAKIHDFCFGIPFGGIVLGGGLVGFIFSRNPASLTTGVLYGGALLALSILSLKIWRQGKSSLPFILGQAVLSAVLFWKNIQTYSLTRKLIPTGFYAAMSASMMCFYLYVVISGGNPPPKKFKSSASVPS